MKNIGQAFRDVLEVYKKYIADNPEAITKYETIFRYASYLVTGRFEDAQLLSEVSYAAVNMLSLFHDSLLRQVHKIDITKSLSGAAERLLQLLSLVEAAEVVVELGGRKLGGATGRWVAVFLVQLVKAFLRLTLLHRHDSGLQLRPPVRALDRAALTAHQQPAAANNKQASNGGEQFRSLGDGSRVMRTLDTAPRVEERTWRAQAPPTSAGGQPQTTPSPSQLTPPRRRAELLHICRPLMHLGACSLFGLDSWKPWLIALSADVYSLWRMGDTRELRAHERRELRQRLLMLLIYLLRSPCYERFSREKLIDALRVLSMYLPLAQFVVGPLLEYLPLWQQLYSYNWSN